MIRKLDDEQAAGLDYSHELVERVQREAQSATALPWWFWEVGAVIFVGVIALSAVYPLGVAP